MDKGKREGGRDRERGKWIREREREREREEGRDREREGERERKGWDRGREEILNGEDEAKVIGEYGRKRQKKWSVQGCHRRKKGKKKK